MRVLTGTVKIDFTAIANEKITLFHDSKNQSLHVIFADGSQDIIEPFFNSRGTILSNLLLEMGPNQTMGGEQFATCSRSPKISPCFRRQVRAVRLGRRLPRCGRRSAGSDQSARSASARRTAGNLNFHRRSKRRFHRRGRNLVADRLGHVLGVVEEEQLTPEIILDVGSTRIAGKATKIRNDVSGNDNDTTIFPASDSNHDQIFNGTLAGLVVAAICRLRSSQTARRTAQSSTTAMAIFQVTR